MRRVRINRMRTCAVQTVRRADVDKTPHTDLKVLKLYYSIFAFYGKYNFSIFWSIVPYFFRLQEETPVSATRRVPVRQVDPERAPREKQRVHPLLVQIGKILRAPRRLCPI